jgi:hypothetical protein
LLRQQLQLLLEREAPGRFVDAAVQHSSSGDADEVSEWSGAYAAMPSPSFHVDQREAAIVSKLGAVIQHLQHEIARSTSGTSNSAAM